jgi:hypothetical protein
VCHPQRRQPYAYANGYCDCYRYSHCNRYGNGNSSCYGNPYSYCDRCAQDNADAKAASDNTASPVGRLLRVLNANAESLREATLKGFRE